MSVILDTSILIRLQKGDPAVKRTIEALSKQFPASPSITFLNSFEYLVGIRLLTKGRGAALKLLENFHLINTTERTAEILASLKSKSEKLGKSLPSSDLIMAGLAMENDMVLVTSDVDFKGIEGLKLEFVE